MFSHSLNKYLLIVEIKSFWSYTLVWSYRRVKSKCTCRMLRCDSLVRHLDALDHVPSFYKYVHEGFMFVTGANVIFSKSYESVLCSSVVFSGKNTYTRNQENR